MTDSIKARIHQQPIALICKIAADGEPLQKLRDYTDEICKEEGADECRPQGDVEVELRYGAPNWYAWFNLQEFEQEADWSVRREISPYRVFCGESNVRELEEGLREIYKEQFGMDPRW